MLFSSRRLWEGSSRAGNHAEADVSRARQRGAKRGSDSNRLGGRRNDDDDDDGRSERRNVVEGASVVRPGRMHTAVMHPVNAQIRDDGEEQRTARTGESTVAEKYGPAPCDTQTVRSEPTPT